MAIKKEHNHIRLGLSQNSLTCGLDGGLRTWPNNFFLYIRAFLKKKKKKFTNNKTSKRKY
jgi:hypothetical protein